jgi:hypothetical protein
VPKIILRYEVVFLGFRQEYPKLKRPNEWGAQDKTYFYSVWADSALVEMFLM